jgi:beta-glucosidase
VATAAYQIEGAAREGGRGASIWDTFAETPGRTYNGDTGEIACDHYHLWEADLDLLVELGIPAYRLSLSWSRLQPAGRGALNSEGLHFYRQLLGGLRSRGIAAHVTLYHWDLPQPLEDDGGWPNRATALAFADYTALVIAELGGLADHWITINEPWCAAFLGYAVGAHAPGRSEVSAAVAAGHHLNLAHGLALERIRAINPNLRVGITNIVADVHPRTSSVADLAAASRLDAANNRFFLDPVYSGRYSQPVHEIFDEYGLADIIAPGDLAVISAPADFVGINHYQRVVAWAHDEGGYLRVGEEPAEPATTSFGWSVTPWSLTAVLERIAREYSDLPIFVTENGASYDDYVDPSGAVRDLARIGYFTGYLDAAAQAVANGVNLQGYFAWSFLDNFEWAEGYSKRFGLVFVEYGTQSRIPKLSAHWYASLIRSHASGTAAVREARKEEPGSTADTVDPALTTRSPTHPSNKKK